ncbi:CRIB domain-containing protein RIC6-like isoform X2 [Nicotiana tabacum]|uniref:CRIB domain-containing protein RIC6-like isoform X2 n=2 Tax=Nicotiana TaxID=4085 RepID=A0A1S4C4G7_TOBAC|nr:PREDICTED: CRIB domain-containing protein RIC8 [Nicotiana sylvestris]
MATKVKGLLKALGISQIFEGEKEAEMQIGLPTDVKHVAHIGWDGPSVESPSWMKEFKEPGKFHTAPLGPPLDPNDHPDIKFVSQDANQKYKNANSSLPDDQPEVSKTSRRHSSSETGTGSATSPKKESKSRRRHTKEPSDGSRSSRHSRPGSGDGGSDSPARDLPDIPKKTRRKKSKEDGGVGSGSSRTSKSKATTSSSTAPMDNGTDTGCESSMLSSRNTDIEKE